MRSRGGTRARNRCARGFAATFVLATTALWAADAPPGAPAGVSLITVSREDIATSGAQSVQQLLRNVPAVTGFGNAAQGAYGSADGSGTYAPTLHGLGAGANNSTLVLIDGHRMPLTGVNHSLADPDVIAPLAIERIELLSEGASARYGSDAVAGVINVITRRDVQGFEATAQSSIANHYHSYAAGLLWGGQLGDTSIIANYSYEFRSHLLAGTRPFARANHTLLDPDAGIDGGGAGNFATNNCSPATVTTTAGTFAYPYNGAAITNADCDSSALADLLPETQRHNVLVKLQHPVGEQLDLSADLVWSRQQNTANINRGAITNIRAWGAGNTSVPANQLNPFFTGPTGVNTETVSWQADDLLGTGATNKGGADALFTTLRADYRLRGDWLLGVTTTVGINDSQLRRDGILCTSCATSALQTSNAANALDVWSVGAGNRTSATVRSLLTDSLRTQRSHQSLQDLNARLEGTLLPLTGGSLRGSVGAEYLRSTMEERLVTPRGNGAGSLNSLTFTDEFRREVKSVYAELLLHAFRQLDVTLADRVDRSSDIGQTNSPKFTVGWNVSQGLTLHGSADRSYTAPALSSRGDSNGLNSESVVTTLNSGNATTGTLTLPASFPGVAQLQARNLAGCTVGSATCILGNNAVTGLQLAGGNNNLTAQTGRSWSVGVDFLPQRLPGLHFAATFWNTRIQGAVNTPASAFIAASPSLTAQAVTLFPNGATAAQIAAITTGTQQTTAGPATTYFVFSTQQRNAMDLDASGIDGNVRYTFRTRWGEFTSGLAASRKIKLNQKFGSDGVSFSPLNTVGVNAGFPSNRLSGRLDIGWKRSRWSASLAADYEGFYRNWNNTAGAGNAAWNVIRVGGLYPVGGGEPIESYTTLDLHAGYDFASAAMHGVTIALDATNLFDNRPPFFNTVVGYDALNASPIDRQLGLGISRKW